MRNIRGLAQVVSIGCACLAFAGTVNAAENRDTIVAAINADIRSTEPGIVNRDDNTDIVMSHIVESLVAYRADTTVAPMLADTVSVSPDSATFTFKLRDGVTFQDGTRLTAADVKWNWERFLDPKTNWRCRTSYDGTTKEDGRGVKIVAIDTPDPRTVIFRLDAGSSLFLTLMASVQCSTGLVARSSLDGDGKWLKPVGTGPYRLAEWRRGQFVLLEKFDAYAARREAASGLAGDKTPKSKFIKFLIVPDPATARAAVVSGDIDVLNALPLAAYEEFKQKPGINLVTDQQLGWTALLLQTQDPLLADVRIRRAIAHAIDIGQIARSATRGLGTANPSLVPVGSKFHTPAQLAFPAYDVEKARALLKEAGYQGQRLVITTTKSFANIYDNSVAIQSMLVQAGFNAELSVVDWPTELAAYQNGKFQLASFTFSGRFDPTLFYDALVGDKTLRKTAQWDSKAAADLVGKTATTTDPAERQKLFDQLQRLMAEDVPIVGLYNVVNASVSRSDVTGFRTWPGGTPILWGAEKTAAAK